jgi:CRP-like cAMP-binding protein
MVRETMREADPESAEAELARLLGKDFVAAGTDRGFDFESRDRREAIELKHALHGVRDFRAAVLQLALLARESPELRHATLIARIGRISSHRIAEEWQHIQRVLHPQVASRIALIALTQDRTVTLPENDADLDRLTALAERALRARGSRGSLGPFSSAWTPRLFDVWMTLLDGWLQRESPLTVKQIEERSGCSYPTVVATLERLEARGEIERGSDRRARLSMQPRRSLEEILIAADSLRPTIRYVDASGRAADPEALLRRIQSKAPPRTCVGGVVAARHYADGFDLHGTPRIDLSVPGGSHPTWLSAVDPALRPVTRPNEPPVLVVHLLGERRTSSEPMHEGPLLFASPAETLLDLYDLRLTTQAEELIETLRRDAGRHG